MTHPALNKQNHRPWPMPEEPWTGRQTWCNLLFAHWPIPAEDLRPLVPEPLKIQEYEGTSWIGIIPFHLKGLMIRSFPSLPWISSFPELNLRLYVEYEDKPGVWFLSLDAANPLAVWAARHFVHLPYFNAEMEIKEESEKFYYFSSRKNQPRPVRFEAVYEPVSDPYEAESGSLEQWLTERYCLYSQSPGGEIYRLEIHHWPWLLQKAKAEFPSNTLTDPFGIQLPETPPLLHFSYKQKVINWLPEKVGVVDSVT